MYAPHVGTMTDGISVANEVSQLFRTRRVSEIRAIEASVRGEAEELSSNLRTLLGTRYSDLLLAVDAVEDSRTQARQRVRDAVASLGTTANSLREEFRAQSRAAAAPVAPDIERRRETSAIGSSLLHIVDSPEFLYACLESGRVYDACVRFVAAEQAYAALCAKEVRHAFVDSRWAQVEAFRSQILSLATEKLAVQNLSRIDYAGFIVAMLALGSVTDLVQPLDLFLRERSAWISKLLHDNHDQSVPSSASVLTCFSSIAKILRETMICFVEFFCEDLPLVEDLLRALDIEAAIQIAQTPQRPLLISKLVSWLDEVRRIIAKDGESVVENVRNAKDLANCLQSIENVFHEDSKAWERACSRIAGVKASDGSDMFTSVLHRRANEVAALCTQEAVNEVITDFETTFAGQGLDSNIDRNDVGDLAWSSLAHEVVQSSLHEVAQNVDTVPKQFIRMGPAAKVIAKLEKRLEMIMADIALVSTNMPDVANSFRDAARSELPRFAQCLQAKVSCIDEQHLQTGKVEHAEKSFGDIRWRKETYFLQDESLQMQALFVASTASALLETGCVSDALSFERKSKDEGSANRLAQNIAGYTVVRDIAVEASKRAYDVWARSNCSAMSVRLEKELKSIFSLEICASYESREARADFTVNDSPADLMLSDANGTNSADSAKLVCPVSPSPAALRFAMSGCNASNNAGGRTLPQLALDSLTKAMQDVVITVYQNVFISYVSQRESNRSRVHDKFAMEDRPENVYLQFLFDIKFLARLLESNLLENVVEAADNSVSTTECSVSQHMAIHSENQEARFQTFQQMETLIAGYIDPINMASARQSLTESVSSYVARSEVLLGTLTRSLHRADMGRRQSSSSGSSSTGLIALAPTVPRFVYLPAPMPSTYNARSGLLVGLGARAAVDLIRDEISISSSKPAKTRDTESSVADYASRLTENVGRLGKFLESFRTAG